MLWEQLTVYIIQKFNQMPPSKEEKKCSTHWYSKCISADNGSGVTVKL